VGLFGRGDEGRFGGRIASAMGLQNRRSIGIQTPERRDGEQQRYDA
jgi:hypothetical protein